MPVLSQAVFFVNGRLEDFYGNPINLEALGLLGPTGPPGNIGPTGSTGPTGPTGITYSTVQSNTETNTTAIPSGGGGFSVI